MRNWAKHHGAALLLLALLVGFSVVSFGLSLYVNGGLNTAWGAGFWQVLGAQFLGGLLTLALLEWLLRIRLQQRDESAAQDAEKTRLIDDLGSADNTTALNANRLLRTKGWLMDGTLQEAALQQAKLQGADLELANLEGARLRFANLQGASLGEANLQGASLGEADLQGARMWHAKLQQAALRFANLQGAVLWEADLQGADLRGANLQGADLWQANLQGADLRFANLQGASLSEANLVAVKLKFTNLQGAGLSDAEIGEVELVKATLPDGSDWTETSDLQRFTNPKHPDYKQALQAVNSIRKELGVKPLLW